MKTYVLPGLCNGISKYESLKSIEVTHSPACREVLIFSDVSILNDSVFRNRKVLKVHRFKIGLHQLLGFGTSNSLL